MTFRRHVIKSSQSPSIDIQSLQLKSDTRLEMLLGEHQEKFQKGNLSVVKLGSSYGGYGTFLPTQARVPSVPADPHPAPPAAEIGRPVKNRDVAKKRVKIYRLNNHGIWDDKGIGHVSVEYLEFSDAASLVVINEEDYRTLLVHRISADDIYRRQEGTIISWTDPEVVTNLALSFEEAMDCNFIWELICSVQRSIHFRSVAGSYMDVGTILFDGETGLDGAGRPSGADLEHSGTSQDYEGGNAGLMEKLYSYLRFAEECIEAVEKMSTRNFNNEQCDYLVVKLKVAVQSASLFLEVSCATSYGPRSSLDIAKHVENFKLLLALAKQIQSFVEGCCKDAWIQAAMTLTNMSEYVSSLGFNLELCKVAFYEECAPTESLTMDQVGKIHKVEVENVEKMASADVVTLLAKVTLQLNSLSGENRDLASYLLQRLLRVQAEPASSTLGSSSWWVNEGSFLRDLFKWVKPAKRLGRGSTADVHKAIWLGTAVAKKTFQGRENPDFMREVGILAKLRHPNIMSMFCCAKEKRKCAIVMELMDEDLHDLMQRRCDGNNDSPPFTILEALDIMLQVGEGVKYLHSQRIVHRDLKSYNILVKSVKVNESETEYVHAKVGDFGLSKTKDCSTRYTNQTFNTGTNRWMAPEIIKSDAGSQESTSTPKYPFKCDVYSFAMVCYEILSGDQPFFEEMSSTNIKEKVMKGERPDLPNHCHHLLKALIKKCWNQVPQERPSFPIICLELKHLKYLLMTGRNEVIEPL